MTHAARLRPLLTFLALLLLGGWPGRCFADYGVTDASKERAKELGITVRSGPSANGDLRVEVEFKAAGPLKHFSWADLDVMQGGKRLVATALLPRKPASNSPAESKLLAFYIDPAALPNATVTIFVQSDPLGGEGYRLKMKDYLPPASR